MTRTLRSRNDDGLATVEFAMVGSLLFVLIFGIISVGLFIIAHTRAADEARMNARAEAVKPDCLTNNPTGVVTGHGSASYGWIIPGIPAPDSDKVAKEDVQYRCGA